MIRPNELIERIQSYNPTVDQDLIMDAYNYGLNAHITQFRESGEPYFSHPLEVTMILTEMKLDIGTIITAMLHDTVEDTDATLEEIEKLFGREVALLVDGVTKLSQIELRATTKKAQQAENFRKLVLAMSNDIRVLLVKLADRVHNMRTLHFVQSEEKRRRIARETLDIYAPLAERIGTTHFKDELQDLAFRILNNDARESIVNRLNFLEEKNGSHIVPAIVQGLGQLMNDEDITAEVLGRLKSPYSIWQKMRKKNILLDQLSDIMAFRIVVGTVQDCYKVLGILHSTYHVIPGRFKDFISTPKANNYQSLHTSVIGPNKHRIEVQIRTRDMHEVAELGVAAHWQYKELGSLPALEQQKAIQEKINYKWLRSLIDILETAAGPEEFLEHTKMEMFQDQVFCFSPAGDLITLPSGSTPIDFAYAIHSEVGNHCVAAKVNSRMVPLRTILQNGDQVEITTSPSQSPSPSWERFVVTGKARIKIRRFIRTKKREEYTALGKQIIFKAFEQERLSLNDEQLSGILNKFKHECLNDLYERVGEGLKNPRDLIRLIYPAHKFKLKSALQLHGAERTKQNSTAGVLIRGLIPGMAVHYAGCCHPLPGDKIVGIIVAGRGVTIHTFDCDTLQSFQDDNNRWLNVDWSGPHDEDVHIGRLFIMIHNRQGALASLTTTISKNHANIVNLKITNRSENFYEFHVDLEVKNAEHLNEIMASLRASPFIHSVERI